MSEGIDFQQDGNIIIDTGETQVKIRRPKVRTYRHFRNRLEATADEMKALRDRIQTLTAELRAAEDSETDRLEDEITTLSRQVADTIADHVLEWVSEVITQLGDGELGESDDWPMWLTNQEIPSRMLRHWQSLPLASGSPPATVHEIKPS